MNKPKYESIIGLEIHLQLKTASKMFCSCEIRQQAEDGEGEPNTTVCPVCMGHPGTLPVANLEAIRQGIRLALALNGSIAEVTRFDRKNYFYPDLPKGYQISQYTKPLATGGYLIIGTGEARKRFGIERLHLEEDAAKNFHRDGVSLVDFNRAGVPLAEVVTKPDFRSPQQARAFLQELRLIARYLDASDADMEKGQLRVDANVSLRTVKDTKLYAKTEVKNLNSFRSVERALVYEIERQTKLWERGDPPAAGETRGWDENKGMTVRQRGKEESHDYRYFPEPDLRPLAIEEKEIEKIRLALPELPEAKRKRFEEQYELKYDESAVLVADKKIADYFEAVISELQQWLYDISGGDGTREELWKKSRRKLVKLAHSWMTAELFKHLKSESQPISVIPITAEDFAEFIALVYESKVNSSAAQTILAKMYRSGGDPSTIARDENLMMESGEEAIRELVREALAGEDENITALRRGKIAVMKYFIGKVMKASKGKANPKVIEKLLKEEIGE